MLQDRAIARNPAKGNSSRWYVCGLREVRKHIKLGKARMVVLAPNIEQVRGGWQCWVLWGGRLACVALRGCGAGVACGVCVHCAAPACR
jgi:hypothetical protein